MSEENHDEIRQKLYSIRKSWVKKLPGIVTDIQDHWRKLQEMDWEHERLQKLHHIFHTLAGASGTFGFSDIGLAAREAELLLKPLRRESREASETERVDVDEKLEIVCRLCEQAYREGASPPPTDYVSQINQIREENSKGYLIHLVEDNPELSDELARQLELHSYNVQIYSSLKEFQAAIDKQEPDYVIMDVELPDGNGAEMLQKINQQRRQPLNAVFVSVHDDLPTRLEAVRAGGESFIAKPVDVPSIIKKLDNHLKTEFSSPLRVMIIDDSVSSASHYSMLLVEAGLETSIVNDPMKAFECLAEFLPDIILMDLHMPDCNGKELTSLIRQHESYYSIPIVFLSAEEDLDSRLLALELGGDEFLVKSMPLNHIVKSVIQRGNRFRQVRSSLTRDELTGLPNRNTLKERLKDAMRQCQRTGMTVAFALVDLNMFSKINNSLGHQFGDEVLKEVALRIKNNSRPGDSICRLNGDEFGIILMGAGQREASGVARRIEYVLSQPVSLNGRTVHLGCGIGLALYPKDTTDVDVLIKNASMALKSAKSLGHGGHIFYKETMQVTALDRLKLEEELRKALQNNEFVLHYQPKVTLPDQKIIGMEALVRWNHPQRGLIYPGDFLTLAEETGLIIPLGDKILRQACTDAKIWFEQGYDLTVAVNLSCSQFAQPNLVKQITEILHETGLSANRLELEITESMVMIDSDKAIALLQELRDIDINIAVDDFGTGYSSLSYLKQFPINALKIDRSFIRDMHKDDNDYSIVKAIISMGHSLHLNIVAEGVELKEQMDFLTDIGCETIQGFYFSKPLDKEAFAQLLLEGFFHDQDDEKTILMR